MRSVRFPLPPMQIGGCGRCGPFGCFRAAFRRTGRRNEAVGGQQPDQHLALEAVEPLLDAAERMPWRRTVPAGADTELEPAAGDDAQRRGHGGQHRRMAVVHTGHQCPAGAGGGLRQRGQRRPALQHGPGRVGEDRMKWSKVQPDS